MTEDQGLLRQYVGGSIDALNELIRRYRDLVYSSALRQVRDAHLAEDVTQAVFIVLSRKASTIRPPASLGGWLLIVTRRAALDAMRKQATQHRHERAAAKTEAVLDPQAAWEKIDPMFDSVMAKLSRKDRDAVVSRFFQDRSFAQVGQELGLSEEAARKRVGRALEKLRSILGRRGMTFEGMALGTMITTHAVRSMPPHLVISADAVSHSAMGIAKGTINMLMLAKAKIVASSVAAVLLVSTTTGIVLLKLPQLHAQAQNKAQPSRQLPVIPVRRAPVTTPSSGPADAQIRAAKTDIANLETALDAFEIDTGRYPTQQEGLSALLQSPFAGRLGSGNWHGPYVTRLPNDPWGHPYRYLYPGRFNKGGFDLWSAGPDGIDSTEDDIANWAR